MFVWQAHKGKVRSLAFSPDGSLLATATGTGRLVNLWNPATGALVRKLDPGGDDKPVQSVAFAPGAPLLAAGMHRSARVWDTNTWEVVATLAGSARGSGPFFEVAFGPGPEPTLAAGDSSRVDIWHRAGAPGARKPDQSLRVAHVPSLDFAPVGALLATNELAKAELWNPADGARAREVSHTHSAHHGPVKFSPDGTRLAVGYRSLVSIYPVLAGDGEEVVCRGHSKAVWAACWSRDGRTLLSASADGTARLWDPVSGAELKAFNWDIGKILAAAFSGDGLLGAAASQNGKIVVWDVDE